MSKFYVRKITFKGAIVAYGVYDNVNGMVSEHARYDLKGPTGEQERIALYLAAQDAKDRNEGIE